MNDINKNSAKIQKMFDEIAYDYDFLNNIISFFTHFFIKTKAIEMLEIKSGSKILDLCCGSGDLGRIILKKNPDVKIVGVDFSSNMLNIAKNININIEYFKMDALNLDFSDNSFDYVVMGFGLRNIENKEQCLSEIYRVLKKDGYFLHLDFGQKNLITLVYDKIILFLSNFFKNKNSYLYLIESKKEFDTPEVLIEKFKKEGFNFFKIKYFLFKNISAQVMRK